MSASSEPEWGIVDFAHGDTILVEKFIILDIELLIMCQFSIRMGIIILKFSSFQFDQTLRIPRK